MALQMLSDWNAAKVAWASVQASAQQKVEVLRPRPPVVTPSEHTSRAELVGLPGVANEVPPLFPKFLENEDRLDKQNSSKEYLSSKPLTERRCRRDDCLDTSCPEKLKWSGHFRGGHDVLYIEVYGTIGRLCFTTCSPQCCALCTCRLAVRRAPPCRSPVPIRPPPSPDHQILLPIPSAMQFEGR